jgi:hypothetical protein
MKSNLAIQNLLGGATSDEWKDLANLTGGFLVSVDIEINALPPLVEFSSWEAELLPELIQFRETIQTLANQLGLEVC